MSCDEFTFLDPGQLIDGDLELRLVETRPPSPRSHFAPSYTFHMIRTGTDVVMGSISLRVGDSEWLRLYAGQIGYGVDAAHRGHRYAARSCRLLLPLARAHGLDPVWITVSPENAPSRRTCEIIGARMTQIVDVPSDSDMYQRGERRKCVYRLDLGEVQPL